MNVIWPVFMKNRKQTAMQGTVDTRVRTKLMSITIHQNLPPPLNSHTGEQKTKNRRKNEKNPTSYYCITWSGISSPLLWDEELDILGHFTVLQHCPYVLKKLQAKKIDTHKKEGDMMVDSPDEAEAIIQFLCQLMVLRVYPCPLNTRDAKRWLQNQSR